MPKKILVVDDSAFARAIMRQILENAGYAVSEASSGLEALEMFPQVKPDLITIDLLMPEMEGEELLQHFHALAETCPVVVITADIQTITRNELLKGGAAGFLNKPVNENDLLDLVQRILGENQGA